ncbi:MAG: hypothetical protein WKF73_07100 [Nocardioidaceae bacterium]
MITGTRYAAKLASRSLEQRCPLQLALGLLLATGGVEVAKLPLHQTDAVEQ